MGIGENIASATTSKVSGDFGGTLKIARLKSLFIVHQPDIVVSAIPERERITFHHPICTWT